MKITVKSPVTLGLSSLLAILSVGAASAQADLGKALLEKLTARVAKLESACASDIKKYKVESLLVCCRTNRQRRPVVLMPFKKSKPWPPNSNVPFEIAV